MSLLSRVNRLATGLLGVSLVLVGCSSSPTRPSQDSSPDHVPIDPWSVPEPRPRQEPKSRYGNPASYEVFGKRYHVLDSAKGYQERGLASWYGTKFHGRRTSSGEPYDMFALTAAHKSLPLPTYVRVTNLENGQSLIVKVNDRGPFHEGRIIDLSYSAAVRLGVYAKGSARVEVVALDATAPHAAPVLYPPPEQNREPAPAPNPQPEIETELDTFISNLPSSDNSGERLAFLQVASFRKLSACTQVRDALSKKHVLALQILEQGDFCHVVQGPFASPQDAQTQAETLRALGYTPAMSYP